jgi:hypothetical protein
MDGFKVGAANNAGANGCMGIIVSVRDIIMGFYSGRVIRNIASVIFVLMKGMKDDV